MMHEYIEQDEDTRIIKHKRTSNFTIIYNACINDNSLSAEAIAILVYVISKPDDWVVKIKNICNRFKIGRDKTYNTINKLIELGYMKRVRQRNADGSLGKTSIYASDKPMFLGAKTPCANDERSDPSDEPFVNCSTDKQPRPENQEMVLQEKTNKQPYPEQPDLVNQDVVPYIQNKDINKENNNNKIISNPIAGCDVANASKASDIYPDASVVVFFMKKIEGSGVLESTMVSWLRKHGADYVAEKIRIFQAKGTLVNPGGFLSAAMMYDWKEKAAAPQSAEPNPETKSCNLTDYPTHKENQVWFSRLSDSEKNEVKQLAVVKHFAFDEMLKTANGSVLDEGFVEGFLFKLMMELVGRSKR